MYARVCCVTYQQGGMCAFLRRGAAYLRRLLRDNIAGSSDLWEPMHVPWILGQSADSGSAALLPGLEIDTADVRFADPGPAPVHVGPAGQPSARTVAPKRLGWGCGHIVFPGGPAKSRAGMLGCKRAPRVPTRVRAP